MACFSIVCLSFVDTSRPLAFGISKANSLQKPEARSTLPRAFQLLAFGGIQILDIRKLEVDPIAILQYPMLKKLSIGRLTFKAFDLGRMSLAPPSQIHCICSSHRLRCERNYCTGYAQCSPKLFEFRFLLRDDAAFRHVLDVRLLQGARHP